MRRRVGVARVLAFGFLLSGSTPAMASENVDPTLSFLPFSFPSGGTPLMGQHAVPGQAKDDPGVRSPLVALPEPRKADPVERTRDQILDDLFRQLATAEDADAAGGIATRIQALLLRSGSDTADLLMSRAAHEAAKGDTGVALDILGKVVTLDPGFGEGWNKRATLRFELGDDFGAMEDLVHVLTLEPRHFGAISGMGLILQRHGMKKEALAMMRKATSLYPHNAGMQTLIDALVPDVEGRDI